MVRWWSKISDPSIAEVPLFALLERGAPLLLTRAPALQMAGGVAGY